MLIIWPEWLAIKSSLAPNPRECFRRPFLKKVIDLASPLCTKTRKKQPQIVEEKRAGICIFSCGDIVSLYKRKRVNIQGFIGFFLWNGVCMKHFFGPLGRFLFYSLDLQWTLKYRRRLLSMLLSEVELNFFFLRGSSDIKTPSTLSGATVIYTRWRMTFSFMSVYSEEKRVNTQVLIVFLLNGVWINCFLSIALGLFLLKKILVTYHSNAMNKKE